MSSFVVRGNKRLSGEVYVSGSKNAALPLVFASMIVRGTSVFYNLPDISDIAVAIKILQSFGAIVYREGNRVYINSENLEYKIPSPLDTAKLRASTYLIGAMLVRFGRAPIMQFGGCNFDFRPIDMHVLAASEFGAVLDGDVLVAKRLSAAEVHFDKISVGATVNALILAAGTDGVSRIYNYASEPHVDSLIDFLTSAGARITKRDSYIEVVGGNLHSATVEVVGDMIEAGTFLAISLMTNSDVTVRNADYTHLSSYFNFLTRTGALVEFSDYHIKAFGKSIDYTEIITEPYPGFPTDLQPIAAPLLAFGGGGRIYERVWHGRFGYLEELSNFGVKYKRYDGYADIYKSKIKPARARATDLRGGAALLISALSAEGESIIDSSEIIMRGYENIIEKLSALGADIKERNT